MPRALDWEAQFVERMPRALDLEGQFVEKMPRALDSEAQFVEKMPRALGLGSPIRRVLGSGHKLLDKNSGAKRWLLKLLDKNSGAERWGHNRVANGARIPRGL